MATPLEIKPIAIFVSNVGARVAATINVARAARALDVRGVRRVERPLPVDHCLPRRNVCLEIGRGGFLALLKRASVVPVANQSQRERSGFCLVINKVEYNSQLVLELAVLLAVANLNARWAAHAAVPLASFTLVAALLAA